MSEDTVSDVFIYTADNKVTQLSASQMHPANVENGHLHIFNYKGYITASFAPGAWTHFIQAPFEQAKS